MCKGKQELELLGKHEQGCSLALTWSLPQQLCGAGSLLHKCHVASWVNSWSQKAAGIVPGFEGQQWCPAGAPQRFGEHAVSLMSALGTCYPSASQLVPEGCSGEWGKWGFAPSGITFGELPILPHWEGVQQVQWFLHLSWEVGVMLGLSGVSPFSYFFTIVVPICPSGFWVPEYFAIWIISARPCTLCLAHPTPAKMTSIEFVIMQVFYSLQMLYLLQWLLIAALTNFVEAKQPSTTAFFLFVCLE